jgi:oligopeptide transport system substrate-binding protein
MSQAAWLRSNMPGVLRVTPSLALAYVAINLADPALKDVNVRQAINLAYNREAITEKVLKAGEPPAYGHVPPGTANYPGGVAMDFRKEPFPARLAEAQKLMERAGYGPFQRLRLSYQTTALGDNRRLAVIFQAMLKPLYVDLDIQVMDAPVQLRNLRLHQFQLASASWYADFNDASNFLDLLRSDSGNNYSGYRNPGFDAALDAAERESDAGKRGRALAAAEAMALKDYPWVPLRFPAQSDLVSPKVKGWSANVRDFHLSRWLSLAR